MGRIHLALVWHQHQPYYKDMVSGRSLLPWVRLHGIKDYIGLVSLLREVPELRQTINLVPSLMVQLGDYLDGGSDEFMDHVKMPADGLSEEAVRFILDHFFMAHWENLINVHPRYGELLAKRAPGRKSLDVVLKRFSTQDLLDLQVWSTLAWFHQTVVENDRTIAGLIGKGRNFSEDDKKVLLEKQREVLARVIPMHRELQDSGQLEVTTTPFYHPILPLLWDMDLAHVALPGMVVPQVKAAFQEDIPEQLSRAVECYKEHFGKPPRGLWPSEGSVAPEVIPDVAQAGFEWLATDEEILGLSTGETLTRDNHQLLKNPDVLYRPYRITANGSEVDAVFRDHYLSDLIGFKYQWMSPEQAVKDFMHRLYAIHERRPERDQLVSVVLDGENAWECYAGGGVPFLRMLYRELSYQSWVTTTRVGDYIREHPPKDKIEHLFAGSWIGHNFATWCGHREKNMGWEYLDRTRLFLERETQKRGENGKSELKDAWEEMYIAEGSDWFWWYGDDHSSGNDEAFDRLFREHCKNVYRFAGCEPPDFLNNAIIRPTGPAIYTSPKTFLSVKLDGLPTSFFEWSSAGHYCHANDAGAMQRVSGNVVSDLYFGFDENTLYLRIDLDIGRPADSSKQTEASSFKPVITAGTIQQMPVPSNETLYAKWKGVGVTVSFGGDASASLQLCDIGGDDASMMLTVSGDEPDEKPLDSFAVRRILEVAVPFEDLQVKPENEIEFSVEISRDGAIAQRVPENTTISFKVPTSDFERMMWQV